MILRIARYPEWGGGWDLFLRQLAPHLRDAGARAVANVERILGDDPKILFADRRPPIGVLAPSSGSVRLVWFTRWQIGQAEFSPTRIGPWDVRVRTLADELLDATATTSILWAAPWTGKPPLHDVNRFIRPDPSPGRA